MCSVIAQINLDNATYVGELDISQVSAIRETTGTSNGLEVPPMTVSPSCLQCFSSRNHNIVVAVVRSQGAIVKGQLGNTRVEVMLDSGSSISLI